MWLFLAIIFNATLLNATSLNQSQNTKSNQTFTLDVDSTLDSTSEAQKIYQKQKELYFLKGQYYYELQKNTEQAQKNRAKNGLFIGVTLGAMSMQINKDSSLSSDGKLPQDINPISFGLMGGYTHYIGSTPIGLRVYGQYMGLWSTASNITDSISAHLLSFNIDAVGEMPIGYEDGYFLGVFGGVGAGVLLFKQNDVTATHIGNVFNVGLSVTLNFHHRIEAGVKFPPTALNADHSFSLLYLANYQYLF